MKEVPSVEQFFRTILNRSGLLLRLPGIDDALIDKAWKRANRIHNYLLDRTDRLDEDCLLCEKKKARGSQTRHVYETPWENEETEKPFCSEECGDIYLYEEPWAYFECGKCDRTISQQNRQNGWHLRRPDGMPEVLRGSDHRKRGGKG